MELELYKRGLDEMAAVALARENVAVLIARGTMLLATSQDLMDSPNGKKLAPCGLD